MAKILVTGGTGFVGSNLVRKLYNGRDEIIIFANTPTHPFLKNLKVKIAMGDIRNYKDVLNSVKGCDYVYHLAATAMNSAEENKTIFGINVLGTENVLKACLQSKVKKIVYVSSSATLGFSKDKRELNEEDWMDFKDNLYGQSKKLGEDKVQEYVARGLNATIAIPVYVMGAGEIDKQRYGLFRSIANGRIKFTYPGGGSTVAVEDLVDGIIFAMQKGRKGERYIFSNECMQLFDFYNLIARELKSPKIRFRLPKISYYPMYMLGLVLKKIMKNPPITTESVRWHFNYKFCDSTKARKELGWNPKVPLSESIRRTIKYYKSIGVLK